MSGPGFLERLAGTVVIRACVYGQRLALRRDDYHEAAHFTAMVLYGNSSGEPELGGCQLPASLMEDGAKLAAVSRGYRAKRGLS